MKTRKRWLAVFWMLLGLACWSRTAKAGGAEDSVTVTITPQAAYQLVVSTGGPAGGLSLGNVKVLTSTFTVNPTTVTVQSSYATTNITLEGLVTQGGIGIEPAPSYANLSTDTDKVGLWAVFTDTGMGAQPQTGALPGAQSPLTGVGAAFVGTVVGHNSAVVQQNAANDVGGDTGEYILQTGFTGGHYKYMYGLPTNSSDNGGSQAELWLGLMLSPATSATAGLQQGLTVVLTATGSTW